MKKQVTRIIHVHQTPDGMFCPTGPIPGQVPESCDVCGQEIGDASFSFLRRERTSILGRRETACLACSDRVEEEAALAGSCIPALYTLERNPGAVELFGGRMFGVVIDEDSVGGALLLTISAKDGSLWRGRQQPGDFKLSEVGSLMGDLLATGERQLAEVSG